MNFAPVVKIDSNYLSIYETCLDGVSDTSTATAETNFFDNFHDCQMSASAMKTVKKSVNLICYLSRKRHFAELRKNVGCTSYRNQTFSKKAVKYAKNSHLCTFLTLTLPSKQKHSDVELTTYLINPFLAYARKFFKVRYYVWKKELQENGNLHFHLILDRYVDALSLRKEWNKLCNRGAVEGVKNPFNYVSEYHKKWSEFYKDGFDRVKVYNYIAELPHIQNEINESVTAWENENNNTMSYAEFQRLANKRIFIEVEKYRTAYDKEMQKPESERFFNPNSTDIEAVKSPKLVSFYLSKYIAKALDNNTQLDEYFNRVDDIKTTIFAFYADIRRKKENEENYDYELQQIEYYKDVLSKFRKENCPIQGRLWFKSNSLTVFLKGLQKKIKDPVTQKIKSVYEPCKDFIYADLDGELRKLNEYLLGEEKRRKAKIDALNAQIIATNEKANWQNVKELHKPCRLVLPTYSKTEAGKDDKNNIICLTFLISCFEIQTLRDKEGKLMFPRLSRMWSMYINNCISENYKKGLYEK